MIYEMITAKIEKFQSSVITSNLSKSAPILFIYVSFHPSERHVKILSHLEYYWILCHIFF